MDWKHNEINSMPSKDEASAPALHELIQQHKDDAFSILEDKALEEQYKALVKEIITKWFTDWDKEWLKKRLSESSKEDLKKIEKIKAIEFGETYIKIANRKMNRKNLKADPDRVGILAGRGGAYPEDEIYMAGRVAARIANQQWVKLFDPQNAEDEVQKLMQAMPGEYSSDWLCAAWWQLADLLWARKSGGLRRKNNSRANWETVGYLVLSAPREDGTVLILQFHDKKGKCYWYDGKEYARPVRGFKE